MSKKEKIKEILSEGTGAIAGICAGVVIDNLLKAVLPAPLSKPMQVVSKIGSMAIGMTLTSAVEKSCSEQTAKTLDPILGEKDTAQALPEGEEA